MPGLITKSRRLPKSRNFADVGYDWSLGISVKPNPQHTPNSSNQSNNTLNKAKYVNEIQTSGISFSEIRRNTEMRHVMRFREISVPLVREQKNS